MTTPSPRRQGGFTLVEVMIALAILFGALVMMLSRVTADVQSTNKAKLLTAATGLARAKMLDLEEELLFKGFQETAEELEGDFSDEGFPRYAWKATIEKVELPPLAQLQAGEQAAEGAGGVGSGITGLMGAGGGNATAAAGSAALAGQFEMVSQILEQAIRKVTLTLTWKAGKNTETLTVVCYFSDPKAVDQGMSGLLGGAGGAAGGEGGTGTGGTGTGGTGTGGTGRGTTGGVRR